jgi:hypothetical protein
VIIRECHKIKLKIDATGRQAQAMHWLYQSTATVSFFRLGKRKKYGKKTEGAYSLVCGILAVWNRNQTFLQFTTNHLDGSEERNPNEDKREGKKKKQIKGRFSGGFAFFQLSVGR